MCNVACTLFSHMNYPFWYALHGIFYVLVGGRAWDFIKIMGRQDSFIYLFLKDLNQSHPGGKVLYLKRTGQEVVFCEMLRLSFGPWICWLLFFPPLGYEWTSELITSYTTSSIYMLVWEQTSIYTMVEMVIYLPPTFVFFIYFTVIIGQKKETNLYIERRGVVQSVWIGADYSDFSCSRSGNVISRLPVNLFSKDFSG